MAERKSEDALRRGIVDAGRAMEASGLSPQRSGNISVRFDGGMLITPSGAACGEIAAGEIVAMSLDGAVAAGAAKPSSEWRMHAGIYDAQPDVHAIVHVHSDHATTLAVMKRPIPAFHYMVAMLGGSDIRCAPYATFGSAELAAHAVAALEGRKACLLAHHGQIAVGATLEEALRLAHEVETLAGQYWRALQIGEPELLDEAEMARVVEAFKTYGRQGG